MTINPISSPAINRVSTLGATEAPVSTSSLAPRAGDSSTLPPDSRSRSLQLSGRIAELERASIETHRRSDRLDQLGALIDELSGLIDRGTPAESDQITQAQSRINELVDSITQTASRGRRGPPTIASDLAPGVTVESAFAPLGPGGSLDVDVQVTQSAQTAGLLLSFGGDQLNLGGAATSDGLADQFVINVGGPGETLQFTFASGSSLADLESAINAFGDRLGLTAHVSGTAVILRSRESGSQSFVSVNIVDDGALNAAASWAGIYRFDSDDANAVDLSSATLFSQGPGVVIDQGQDVEAIVNGAVVVGEGQRLVVSGDGLEADFELSPDLAQNPGDVFKAFAIESRVQPPGRAIGIGGGNPSLTLESAREILERESRALEVERAAIRSALDDASAQLLEADASHGESTPLDPRRAAELLRIGLTSGS